MSGEHSPAENGALIAKIDALNTNVTRLTVSTDRLIEQFGRVGILETNHQNQSQAIERAFAAIEKLQGTLEDHVEEDRRQHEKYDQRIWMASGFCLAVIFFWSVAGYRINAVIDEQIKTISEMRVHLSEDKVKTSDDVRMVHREGEPRK